VDTVKSSSVPNHDIPTKESKLASETPASDNNTPIISGLKRKRVSSYSVPTKQKQSIKKINKKQSIKKVNKKPSYSIKKVKFCHNAATDATSASAPVQLNIPLGTQWQNNSCAYDAIITILFNMWSDPNPATTSLEHTQCVMFDALIKCFHSHESRQVESQTPVFSLEQIREFFRRHIARTAQEFTFGSYASVQSIGEHLFRTQEVITTSNVFCSESGGHNIGRNQHSSTSNFQVIILETTETSLQACIDDFTIELASRCMTCDSHLMKRTTFVLTPPLLAFDISITGCSTLLSLDPVLWISCDNSRVCYNLRGIIYYDNHHFTERVVTSTGLIWFHDGIFTGRSLVYESNDLTSINTENAVMAFYIRSPA
jgi:hypothetical protein